MSMVGEDPKHEQEPKKPGFFTRKEERSGEQPQEAAKVLGEPVQPPKVKHEMVIRIFEDGNAQVDGPFDDPMAYGGLLYVAMKCEMLQYLKAQMLGAARMTVPAKKESWWQRKMRERQQRKAFEATQRAQAGARDELAKALDKNVESESTPQT